MIKIFHTGDVHLDSPFAKFEHEERLSLRKYQRELFLSLCRYVRENKYDLVLISGDLLDMRNVSPEAEECAYAGLSEMGCPVVISPGNHDPFNVTPFYKKRRYPENVFVFDSAEPKSFAFPELGVQVSGYAFFDSNIIENDPLEDFTPPQFDGVDLLCAHGELDISSSRFAPIRSRDLLRGGYVYSALGHIHIPSIDEREQGVVAYSGVLDCRGFDEEGLGGAISVEIDEKAGSVTAKRVIFGKHRYVTDELDVTSFESENDLFGAVLSHIEANGYGKDTALRLTLCGESELDLTITAGAVIRDLGGRLMLLEIGLDVRPRIDTRLLESDFTLRGEIYRTLKSELESDDAERRSIASEALKVALLAAEGREID